jgi:hypothetical protein
MFKHLKNKITSFKELNFKKENQQKKTNIPLTVEIFEVIKSENKDKKIICTWF